MGHVHPRAGENPLAVGRSGGHNVTSLPSRVVIPAQAGIHVSRRGVKASVSAVLTLTPRGQGQGTRYIVEPLGACAASHPVAGGSCYLYVVVPRTNVISILQDGLLAASYQFPEAPGGVSHFPRYTMYAGRNEPVVGGNAYCHVIDRCNACVHVFVNAEYAATEPLPDTGAPLER